MRFTFPSRLSFFGPLHSWRVGFLEEAFVLQRYLNMSHSEVYNLPVSYRKWYIKRLLKEFDSKNNKDHDAEGSSDNYSKLRQYEDMLSKKL